MKSKNAKPGKNGSVKGCKVPNQSANAPPRGLTVANKK